MLDKALQEETKKMLSLQRATRSNARGSAIRNHFYFHHGEPLNSKSTGDPRMLMDEHWKDQVLRKFRTQNFSDSAIYETEPPYMFSG